MNNSHYRRFVMTDQEREALEKERLLAIAEILADPIPLIQLHPDGSIMRQARRVLAALAARDVVKGQLAAVHQTLDEYGAPTHDLERGYKLNANGRLVDFLRAREEPLKVADMDLSVVEQVLDSQGLSPRETDIAIADAAREDTEPFREPEEDLYREITS